MQKPQLMSQIIYEGRTAPLRIWLNPTCTVQGHDDTESDLQANIQPNDHHTRELSLQAWRPDRKETKVPRAKGEEAVQFHCHFHSMLCDWTHPMSTYIPASVWDSLTPAPWGRLVAVNVVLDLGQQWNYCLTQARRVCSSDNINWSKHFRHCSVDLVVWNLVSVSG